MKKVTRNIDLSHAAELLRRAPRACLAFVNRDGPQVAPALLQWTADRYLAGISSGASLPVAGQEVVLLVDEGVYYFDLRAVYVRGQVQPCATSPTGLVGFTWFEVLPTRVVAWDYGTMREVKDEPA